MMGSLWKNPAGFPLVLFFLIGGIAFWVTIPEIYIGQIWVAVAVFLGGLFAFISSRRAAQERLKREGIRGQATILSMTQTGVYINEQPQVQFRLRVEAPGVAPYELDKKATVPMIALGSLSAGRPLTVYIDKTDRNNVTIDWSGGGPATLSHAGGPPIDLNANPQARAAVEDVLRRNGIDPTGPVDLRQSPAVRQQVLDVLGQHGLDPAAKPEGPAAADDGEEPLERLQKLMELKSAQLITDEEFQAQKRRIIEDV